MPPDSPPACCLLPGRRLEPLEEVVCEVEDGHVGEVIEAVTLRKGEVRGARGRVSRQRLLQASCLLLRQQACFRCGAQTWKCLPNSHLSIRRCGSAASFFTLCPRAPFHTHTLTCLQLLEMLPFEGEGRQRLVFEAPARGLIGFRAAFASLTRGTGVLHRAFSR